MKTPKHKQTKEYEMIRILGYLKMFAVIFWVLLFAQYSFAGNLQVANFSSGKRGTQGYEEFSFSVQNGKIEISYTYGKDWKELKLDYLGTGTKNGSASFRVRFSNGFILNVVPRYSNLKIFDDRGKYSKTFSWQYDGPIDGIGTFCSVCVDENEAIPFIKKNFAQ